MRFYNQQHRHYCGIDLHARTMYVCVIDQKGKPLVHRNIPTEPASLLRLLKPYRKDLAVAVECMFCWYWIADVCASEGIRFVLGHVLYMKAIHGGKSKNDGSTPMIAKLLRGGNLPEAYAYPSEMRATRDVLRRRLFFVRHRAGLLTHIQMTNTQNNLPAFEKRIDKARNRTDLLEHFEDEDLQMSVAVDMMMLDGYDQAIAELELFLEGRAKVHACRRPIAEGSRYEAQRWLAERIGADLGSISGEHLGRLAGFKNWKRKGTWGNVLAASRPGRRWDPNAVPGICREKPLLPSTSASDSRQGAMDASPSGREWGWVCGLLENGCAPDRVHDRLLDRSLVRRGSDAPRYARRTIERALQRIGQAAGHRSSHKKFHNQPLRR